LYDANDIEILLMLVTDVAVDVDLQAISQHAHNQMPRQMGGTRLAEGRPPMVVKAFQIGGF